ncbi:MAG: MBL fold metallo-hydrolase [Candidatus Lernaella stagnicola]|nr:MBL fold metallo-hydrolase [Candidatus Lernaella stagnicola]
MSARISPLWWPVMVLGSPILVPLLTAKTVTFRRNVKSSRIANQARRSAMVKMDIPPVDTFRWTVLVEQRTRPGFLGDAAVSYLLETDAGRTLLDVGFGATTKALAHNAAKLDFTIDQIDAMVLSHLHLDHMGGLAAQKAATVHWPESLGKPRPDTPCFLPDAAKAPGFSCAVIEKPSLLPTGLATTGPIARAMFVTGLIQEQALIVNLRGKGLVVITGCGHQTVPALLDAVRRISDEPIYAVGGGLHFPLAEGRWQAAGIDFQRLLGTGKPPWMKIQSADIDRAITALNDAKPERVLLSAHDTDDEAIALFERHLDANVEVLEAGAQYEF